MWPGSLIFEVMMTVGIKNFELWTHLGLYAEEKIIPNRLIFNIKVHIPPELQELFVDYTVLIGMVKSVRYQKLELLEEVIAYLRDEIWKLYPGTQLEIMIEKCPPPTGDTIQSSYVSWAG